MDESASAVVIPKNCSTEDEKEGDCVCAQRQKEAKEHTAAVQVGTTTATPTAAPPETVSQPPERLRVVHHIVPAGGCWDSDNTLLSAAQRNEKPANTRKGSIIHKQEGGLVALSWRLWSYLDVHVAQVDQIVQALAQHCPEGAG
jgi:hypothetical protein